MKRRAAFTLIEILFVVGIIALLVAILVPSLTKVRVQAKRTTCASQLHQVALAMMAYMHDSNDHMPHISFMPSISPAPLTTTDSIYLADVLKKHLAGNTDALECPEDRPNKTERSVPNIGRSFFESERSSYEYRVALRGLTPLEFSKRPHGPPWAPHTHTDDKTPPNTIWFTRDYDNFHGKAGEIGARRYAYIDGHVADYEN